MILYNTTFHIDSSIERDFLDWLREEVAPTACTEGFSEPKLCRLLCEVQEGCSSFAFQMLADETIIENWERDKQKQLFGQMFERWGERALFFSTAMEVMNL